MRLSASFARQRISIYIVSYIKSYIKFYIKLRFDKLNYETREQVCEYKEIMSVANPNISAPSDSNTW